MCGHPNLTLVLLTAVTTVVLVITGILGIAAYPLVHWIPGLFERGIANISDTYPVDISPVDGTFAMWAVIFLWQILWIIYALVSLCRKVGHEPLYVNPILLPSAFHVSFTVSLIATIGWFFLWDRQFISVSLVVMLFTSSFLFFSLGLSYLALDKNIPLLYVQERKVDVWSIRLLVQNGIALYASWAAIESFMILSAVLTYMSKPEVPASTSSTISLGILAGCMLIYALTDFFIFDRFTRFTLTPYAVFIIAFCGMFANIAEVNDVNSIFIVALLATSAVVALTKLFFICLRQITKPSESAETTEFLRELDESRHLLK